MQKHFRNFSGNFLLQCALMGDCLRHLNRVEMKVEVEAEEVINMDEEEEETAKTPGKLLLKFQLKSNCNFVYSKPGSFY